MTSDRSRRAPRPCIIRAPVSFCEQVAHGGPGWRLGGRWRRLPRPIAWREPLPAHHGRRTHLCQPTWLPRRPTGEQGLGAGRATVGTTQPQVPGAPEEAREGSQTGAGRSISRVEADLCEPVPLCPRIARGGGSLASAASIEPAARLPAARGGAGARSDPLPLHLLPYSFLAGPGRG